MGKKRVCVCCVCGWLFSLGGGGWRGAIVNISVCVWGGGGRVGAGLNFTLQQSVSPCPPFSAETNGLQMPANSMLVNLIWLQFVCNRLRNTVTLQQVFFLSFRGSAYNRLQAALCCVSCSLSSAVLLCTRKCFCLYSLPSGEEREKERESGGGSKWSVCARKRN